MKVRVRGDGTAEGTSRTFPRSLYGALVTIAEPAPPKPKRPALSANKDAWVTYAIALGYAGAESFTRGELIERLTAHEGEG